MLYFFILFIFFYGFECIEWIYLGIFIVVLVYCWVDFCFFGFWILVDCRIVVGVDINFIVGIFVFDNVVDGLFYFFFVYLVDFVEGIDLF